MRILGLDPSLRNYGWALHDTEADGRDRCIERGRFQTEKRQFSDEIGRYMHLRECLREKIAELDPDAVGLEHPVMNEDYSEGMYGLFLFTMEAIKSMAKDMVLIGPPQAKKFAKDLLSRPKGWGMGKMDMCMAAAHDAGGGNWDHNEADAYLVAVFAGRFWKFYVGDLHEDELTKYEKKTFTHMRTITKGKRQGKLEIKGFLHREGDRFFLWSVE
jgi:hypothetical protein